MINMLRLQKKIYSDLIMSARIASRIFVFFIVLTFFYRNMLPTEDAIDKTLRCCVIGRNVRFNEDR